MKLSKTSQKYLDSFAESVFNEGREFEEAQGWAEALDKSLRTLTKECITYEKVLEMEILSYHKEMNLEYTIKRWADSCLTVDITRTDVRNADDDTIYMRIEGNYDVVYPAVLGWLESEVNR